jgi:hypothetical protein
MVVNLIKRVVSDALGLNNKMAQEEPHLTIFAPGKSRENRKLLLRVRKEDSGRFLLDRKLFISEAQVKRHKSRSESNGFASV